MPDARRRRRRPRAALNASSAAADDADGVKQSTRAFDPTYLGGVEDVGVVGALDLLGTLRGFEGDLVRHDGHAARLDGLARVLAERDSLDGDGSLGREGEGERRHCFLLGVFACKKVSRASAPTRTTTPTDDRSFDRSIDPSVDAVRFGSVKLTIHDPSNVDTLFLYQ